MAPPLFIDDRISKRINPSGSAFKTKIEEFKRKMLDTASLTKKAWSKGTSTGKTTGSVNSSETEKTKIWEAEKHDKRNSERVIGTNTRKFRRFSLELGDLLDKMESCDCPRHSRQRSLNARPMSRILPVIHEETKQIEPFDDDTVKVD